MTSTHAEKHRRRLGCVYLIDISPKYVQMASWSMTSVRRTNPRLAITVMVVGDEAQLSPAERARFDALAALADEARWVAPLHEKSGYFCDNRAHLAATDFDSIWYLDADTIVFGDLTAVATRFDGCDVAARPNVWAWRMGYRSGLAPDVICPMNSGVVLMSNSFAAQWSARTRARGAGLLTRADRAELAAWLYRISPTAWSREEWAFSEEAWSGPWSVGLLSDSDCHLLARWPDAEEPAQWQRSTILHTYSQHWNRCMERLLAQ